MKQAIQLEIPFDGQALPAASPVPQASPVQSISSDAAEIQLFSAVRHAASRVLAACPSLSLGLQAAACVAFAFGIMFFSAIIGG